LTASSSSWMTICCNQPWELIILSIAGGVAAGASAPLAGATDSNKHKNNTRLEHPARKAPRPRALCMLVKRMPVSRINTVILGRWAVTCSVFFPQGRTASASHPAGPMVTAGAIPPQRPILTEHPSDQAGPLTETASRLGPKVAACALPQISGRIRRSGRSALAAGTRPHAPYPPFAIPAAIGSVGRKADLRLP